MNSLSGADKLWLERSFTMSSGYVLDFTDPSFGRFFSHYGVDIFNTRYEIYGTSKANRLRAFWDLEPDEQVERILFALFDSHGFLDRDSEDSRKSRAILYRLSGISFEERGLESSNGRRQETRMEIGKLQLESLWGPGAIRVFISHIAQHKSEAMEIKESLKEFGIASFVAHVDIEPSSEWQIEILHALDSMNMFVALLTEGFKESNWTDQEVGYAVARNVQILPVSRGIDPYGFIQKFQALKWSRSNASPVAQEVMAMALKNNELKSYAKSTFIEEIAHSRSWAETNRLSHILPCIGSLTPEEADWFVEVYNSNSQVYQEWRIQDNILSELFRMTGITYMFDNFQRLQRCELTDDIPF